MKTYELLKSFAETPGPSGFETRISDLVRETWQPFVDDIDVDRVGNLVGLKNGAGSDPKPKILLAAHMDEIGLMVTKMEAYPDTGGGFLRAPGRARRRGADTAGRNPGARRNGDRPVGRSLRPARRPADGGRRTPADRTRTALPSSFVTLDAAHFGALHTGHRCM